LIKLKKESKTFAKKKINKEEEDKKVKTKLCLASLTLVS